MKKAIAHSSEMTSTCTIPIHNSVSNLSSRCNRWILNLEETPTRIICFHAAGCQPTTFLAWKKHLPENICVVPIILPMHGSRLSENMPRSFQEIARTFLDDCLELFSQPTVLFGHSMGAMIAYEVTRLLQLYGNQPIALIVSGAQSPNRREVVDRTIGLTDSEFLDVLRAYGSIDELLLQDNMFLDYYLPIARTDFALCERYIWKEQPALTVPIHTFNGKEDTHISRDGVEQWSHFTRNGCFHHLFEGGHFYCDKNPAEVCTCIESIVWKINKKKGV